MSAREWPARLFLPGRAAAAWAFAFAAVSFYWAAGGTLLGDAVGADLRSLSLQRDPAFVAVLWATGGLKVLGGLLGLALAGVGGRWLPRLGLLILGWGGGALLAVYGGVPLTVTGLQFAGLLRVTGAVDWNALRWHLLVWDPWWLLGGVLFLPAAGPSRPGPAADTGASSGLDRPPGHVEDASPL